MNDSSQNNLEPTVQTTQTTDDATLDQPAASSLDDTSTSSSGGYDVDTSDPEASTEFALSSLENIIRQRLSIIEKTQLEASELRTQLNDILANSEEYYKADKAMKEAGKIKKQVKATIMGTQEAKVLQGKFDETKNLLKENEDALSEMLVEYYETMRVKEIDDLEGEPRDLLVKVKIAPKKTK